MKALPAIATVAVMTLSLPGCANMSATQQRTVSGAAGGALAGTAIGAIAGDAGMGAAIGAAAGAAGGYIWDRHKKSQEASYEQGYAAAKADSGKK